MLLCPINVLNKIWEPSRLYVVLICFNAHMYIFLISKKYNYQQSNFLVLILDHLKY